MDEMSPQREPDDRVDDAVEAAPSDWRRYALAPVIILWLGLLLLAILVAQRVAVTGPAGMSLPRAAFFVVNSASLTGFEMTWASPQTMTPAHAALWLALAGLTAFLSTTIATAAIARVSGWNWSWMRSCAAALVFLAVLWFIGFGAELTGGRGAPAAAWNACMVATGTGLLAEEPVASDPLLWLARYPLTALAAIGPFVLIDTLRRRNSGRLSRVSAWSWVAVPVSFALAVAIVVGAHALAGDSETLDEAAAVAIDARGTGFADAAHALTPAARWALVPVLLHGGASGGIGGGLKALTAAVLVVGVINLLRRGSAGAGPTFAIAAMWLVTLVLLFGVTLVLLVHTSPQLRPDRAAILAAAACGNAGISVDPVSVAGNDAYVLAGAMLLGRMLPWLVLWWSATKGDEPIVVG